MKRYLVTIVLTTLVTMLTWAQGSHYALGVHVGYDRSRLMLNSASGSDAKSLNATNMNGLKIGLDFEETFWKGMGTVMGFNYTFAGASTSWKNGSFSNFPQTRTVSRYQQLELFVDWQYKFEIAKETYLILYTGPTIQCALQQKTSVQTRMSENGTPAMSVDYDRLDYTTTGLSEKDYPDLNRFNVTWGLGAGFQYQRYFLRGGYDFGIMNPYRIGNFNEVGAADRNTRGRLDQWSVRLGMYLWQR